MWHIGKYVYVITGRGRHSKGSAKIKPAIISYLDQTETPLVLAYHLTTHSLLHVPFKVLSGYGQAQAMVVQLICAAA